MISAALAEMFPVFGFDLATPPSWFVGWSRADSDTDSGAVVNAKTVLTYAPVWMGVNKICGLLSQVPVSVFERVDDVSSREARKHAGRYVLRNPNRFMRSSVFREVVTGHAILQGNGRAYIQRDGRNNPIELIPLLPDRTKTLLVNDEKWHVVTNPVTGEVDKLPDADVLHICGFGYDGIQGYSLVEMARNSFGLGLASEKHANRHFKNNAVPSLVLEAPPGVLKDENEAKEFMRKWNEYHQGLSESNKTALLRGGVKATPLGMTGQDAQWIEQRRFQRQEAAMWLALEQILGDDSSVSYNSLEQKNTAFFQNCLQRWVVKWEEECNEKLLTAIQKLNETHYFRFKMQSLLRPTMKERYEIYNIGRTIEMLSANDCRYEEDMPPIKGGDVYKNPNINPQTPKPGADKTPPEPPPKAPKTPPEPAPNDRATALIRSRIKEIVKVESQRAIDAAAKPNQFTAWLDKFYSDDGFLPRLNAVVLECGGTAEQTAAHCNESRRLLDDLSGRCGADGFAAAVQLETGKWGERAELLTTILSERN